MGKTSMPLRILCEEGMLKTEQIEKLQAQGHEVVCIPFTVNGHPADMILHEHAWQMHYEYMDYLPVAMKAARARRYPKRKKREPTKARSRKSK